METEESPCLRRDIEILSDRPEEPGTVLLYDPVQRAVFELDPGDLPLVKLLDGRHSLPEIARMLRRRLEDVQELIDDLSDAFLLEDPEQEEMLRALRRRNREEDRLLAPVLDSGPVLDLSERPIRVVDDARHDCLRCGACCHYAVPVSPEERHRLETVEWPREIFPEGSDALFQVRPALQWGRLEATLSTRSDPVRCIFLDEENLCRVQLQLGAEAKPFVCRLFPLAFPVVTPEEVLFSLTFECPHIYSTYETGERLAGRSDVLRGLAAEMEEVYILPSEIELREGKSLGLEPFLRWEEDLVQHAIAPATQPDALLEAQAEAWLRLDAGGPPPAPSAEEFGQIVRALEEAACRDPESLRETPEGTEGCLHAQRVLEALGETPLLAWGRFPWADGAAADRFLARFVRHFLEGKQYLLYRTAWLGLRGLALILLLSRYDAFLLARQAGEETVSLGNLNRALSRWCRLLDVRSLRLAYVQTVLRG
ncbi:MAG: YkgJ family cysteine cluster protein [Chloroflexia bacterium]